MKVVETHVETQDLASLRVNQFVSLDFHIKKPDLLAKTIQKSETGT